MTKRIVVMGLVGFTLGMLGLWLLYGAFAQALQALKRRTPPKPLDGAEVLNLEDYIVIEDCPGCGGRHLIRRP